MVINGVFERGQKKYYFIIMGVYRVLFWICFPILAWIVLNFFTKVSREKEKEKEERKKRREGRKRGKEKSDVVLDAWSKKETRKKLLEEYSHAQGFDALVADNWYSHFDSLSQMKVFLFQIYHFYYLFFGCSFYYY